MSTTTLLWIGIVLSILSLVATITFGILILKGITKLVTFVISLPVKAVKGIVSTAKGAKSVKTSKR